MTTTRAVPPPPPPLPPRARTDSEGLTASDVPDEPPPAYEAQPNPATQEQTLQYGPSRPFQPAAAAPHQFYPQHQQQQQSQGPYSPPPSSLPPPNFPFWNGPNLSHQQTGFMPGPLNPPPPQQVQQQGGGGNAYAPPTSPPPNSTTTPTPSPPKNYAPTTVATAGQPLLRNNHILVYPIGKDSCPKCHNTGYKPFVGRGGDDPNHPCRKCWEKFGRPFTGAIRIAATSTPTPPNYQRPLRPSYRPPTGIQFGGGVYPGAAYRQAQRPGMMQQQATAMGNTYGQPNATFNPPSRIHVTHQPPIGGGAVGTFGQILLLTAHFAVLEPELIRSHYNPLAVFRPGDPRLGGMRCYRCGGEGTTWGIFFQEETCDLCRGVGRLY
ncbi:BZ3500_MvSof-1268-A1-R1_Chr11-1g03176 [Microbotryum saponariae]|uniref:BZ3500_MvSof-1268-A1-R1_Chr11-1g03176 protein n=1 Tax=Microbotryum saponariae TaxID=289078 RepID=A0A2X0NC63_9BASI|nr:BZ3501_MvSof-1269-A2-R1_Chr11g02751 [Microbotryum saponariae]SDA03736.1 BZ3500_MvSof-1268-A1-R1_Chr11-1g03176 [Microbotryum saponariae]